MRIGDKEYCLQCMKPLHDSSVCGFCHFDNKSYISPPHCLASGTCLNHRYFVGKMLGEGGFGITYIGWDSVLSVPVAVKEYYPEGMVRRDSESSMDGTVNLYGGIDREEYKKGIRAFLQEARSQAQFSKLDGIASVRDFFRENNTAYIVMEYIEGLSAKQYVERYGRIPAEEVVEMAGPVLQALQEMHDNQIVHRDVSADNLMITNQKRMKLIDFGTSRQTSATAAKTMTVMYKRGFSPEEQYRAKGKIGPWTDVYGVCAAMYYLISGTIPEEAPERIMCDDLLPLKDMPGIDISASQSDAIEKGLSVRLEYRQQTINELYYDLYGKDLSGKEKKEFGIEEGENPMLRETGDGQGNQNAPLQAGEVSVDISTHMVYRSLEDVENREKIRGRGRQKKRILIVAASLVIVGFAVLLAGNKFSFGNGGDAQNKTESLHGAARPSEEGERQQATVSEMPPSEQGAQQAAVQQNPSAKPIPVKKEKMLNVVGLSAKTAVKRLHGKGFSHIKIKYAERENAESGRVIGQNISKGCQVALSKRIVLTVAKRIKPKMTEPPKVADQPTAAPKKADKPKPGRKKEDDNVVGSLDSLLR